MAYQMDFFAGIESKVLAAIGDKVQYPAYVFVRDEEDLATGRLAFVDQGNVLKYIRGENKQHVVNVAELPDVSDGDIEVLYVVGEIVYLFNGENFIAINSTEIIDLDLLTERIESLETTIVSLNEQIAALKESNADIVEKLATVTEQVTDIEERVEIVEKETLTFVELE